MTNKSPKQIALKTLIKYKSYSLNNYTDLRHIIESNQFTVIEYKKHTNSEYVSELIKRLRVESEIEQNDSFLYINNNLKFVFINAEISDEDKCSLLRHELGHICDPDLQNSNSPDSRIKREEFANEFSCYTKKPGICSFFYIFLIKKWKLLVPALVLTACVAGSPLVINNFAIPASMPALGNASTYAFPDSTYYVTSAGKKYHQKHCIIIKYKNNLTKIKLDDAINEGYKPCKICNPEE